MAHTLDLVAGADTGRKHPTRRRWSSRDARDRHGAWAGRCARSGWAPPRGPTRRCSPPGGTRRTPITPRAGWRYYAWRFPVVEVDSTYYTPPNERNSALWVAAHPRGLHLQHQGVRAADRPSHPGRLALQGPAAGDRQEERLPQRPARGRRRRGVGPLPVGPGAAGRRRAARGRCCSSSRRGSRSAGTTSTTCWSASARASRSGSVVELRNASWLSEDNRAETLDFLTSYALPYVCVDMPQGHRSSIPPVVAATARPRGRALPRAQREVDQQGHPREVRLPATPSRSCGVGAADARSWPSRRRRRTCS